MDDDEEEMEYEDEDKDDEKKRKENVNKQGKSSECPPWQLGTECKPLRTIKVLLT